MPVPPHLWHRTILSPFLRVPFPSQFLHGFFFSPILFRIQSSKFDRYQYTAEHLKSVALICQKLRYSLSSNNSLLSAAFPAKFEATMVRKKIGDRQIGFDLPAR